MQTNLDLIFIFNLGSSLIYIKNKNQEGEMEFMCKLHIFPIFLTVIGEGEV